jgi:flagellar hook-associated protein 3 FlgL
MVYLTSTSTLTSVLRNSILEMQKQLSQTQVEVSSGRVADLGLSLGAAVGQDFNLGIHQADIKALTQSNNVVSARLDATQTALSAIADTAKSFLNSLVSAQSNGTDATTIENQANANLKSLISGLNTTANQEYLFGGVNCGVAPISDYFSSPQSAGKQAVDQAYIAAFGFSQSGAGVNSITASQMQNLLSGTFANLFSSTSWSSDWSNASSQTMQSRISLTQTVNTSVSANDPALQKLAMAYTMVADLGTASLSDPAYQTLVQTATQTMSDAVSGLTRLQASVGIMQKTVTNASDLMSVQQNAITSQIGSLEDVDPYEASTRLNSLMTQIETSYVLTGKIQQLTLSKYI